MSSLRRIEHSGRFLFDSLAVTYWCLCDDYRHLRSHLFPDCWWAMNAMIVGAATTSVVRARPTESSPSTYRIFRHWLDAGGVQRGRGIIDKDWRWQFRHSP
jgi:hypothetical protein